MPVPDPVDWRPPEPLHRRLLQAAGVPVLAGAAVFVVAVIIAIALVLLRPHSVPVEAGMDAAAHAGLEEPQPGTEQPGGTSAETEPGVDADAARTVFVHVVGEVHEPGVVELPGDARVEAAIAAAGGVTEAAELVGVNLARVVADGEQIVVPDEQAAAEHAPNAGSDTSGGSASSREADSGGTININTADVEALKTLPRIGPSLAERILDWRELNGSFTSVDQLLDVSGIGEKTLEGFRDRVTV